MGYWAKDGSYVHDSEDFQKKEEQEITFNPTGETGSGSIYDADQETLEGIERMVQGQKKVDEVNQVVIDNLLQQFPQSSQQLTAEINKVGMRLDLMQKLVEGYRDEFFKTANKYVDNFSKEASKEVNDSLTKYLCIIETLKSAGYNFGSMENSYVSGAAYGYDPYKPSVGLDEVMTTMHQRRKEGADIEIPIPVEYNIDTMDQQVKIDGVTATYLVDKHLRNTPYMNDYWQEVGYVSMTDNVNSNDISK